jgi:hypothetical protein
MKAIRHHLKHWFVAQKRNDHRPHLIRRTGLLASLAMIILMQGGSLVIHPAAHGSVLAYATDINAANLLTLTNQQRASAGLPTLHYDSRLATSAGLKAANMYSENYWAHVSPSGIQPWYWFGQAGYAYTYAGENLAKDFDTSAGVMDGWMNSPGHRANILNANYVDVGFAVVNGTLQGGQTTLVVAHYGAQAHQSVAATTPAPVQTPRPIVTTIKTPLPTLVPTPPFPVVVTPRPTPIGTPIPSVGEITQAPLDKVAYRPIAPLAVARSSSAATNGTIIVLIIVLGVYLHTHLVVWRKGLKRWRRLHYRLWAGAQISGLMAMIFVVASRGFGVVG